MSAIQDILEILEGNQFCEDDFDLLDQAVKMKKSGLPGQKVSPELLALHRKCRVARNNGETMVCPKCGGVEIVKNGKKDGRQRYLCKWCRKTFGDTFGTIFYHSKLDLSSWKKLIELTLYKQSLRAIKRDANISVHSAWFNRHKLIELMKQQAVSEKFPSITEGDEYYTPVSYQGVRDATFFIEELGRIPRHCRSKKQLIEYAEKAGYEVVENALSTGKSEIKVYKNSRTMEVEGIETIGYQSPYWGMAKKEAIEVNGLTTAQKRKRGISKEQVCVLSLIDRSSNTYLNPVCVGRVTEKTVSKNLKHRFQDDAILVTDKHRAYKGFSNEYNISHRQIPANKHVHNGFSLARVNSFHSRLATFQEPLKQVGSRHLDNYLALFRWTDLMRNEQTGEKLSMVLEMMTKKVKLLKRENLSHRPYPFDTKGMAVPA